MPLNGNDMRPCIGSVRSINCEDKCCGGEGEQLHVECGSVVIGDIVDEGGAVKAGYGGDKGRDGEGLDGVVEVVGEVGVGGRGHH